MSVRRIIWNFRTQKNTVYSSLYYIFILVSTLLIEKKNNNKKWRQYQTRIKCSIIINVIHRRFGFRLLQGNLYFTLLIEYPCIAYTCTTQLFLFFNNLVTIWQCTTYKNLLNYQYYRCYFICVFLWLGYYYHLVVSIRTHVKANHRAVWLVFKSTIMVFPGVMATIENRSLSCHICLNRVLRTS
jgi:hypothetical protein